MARVTNSILGEVRGKVGKEVRKIRNGKPYTASVPSTYTMSNEPHVVEQRNLFKVNGKFSSAVNNVEILKKIWEREKAPATNAYNRISSINYVLSTAERPTEENIITPAGFELTVKHTRYSYDKIEFEIKKMMKEKDDEFFVYILLTCFYEPKKKRDDYFAIEKIIEETKEPEDKLIFKFEEEIKLKNRNYKKKIIYLAAVILNEQGEIAKWSSTFSKTVE